MLSSSNIKLARNALLVLMLLYAFVANIMILVKLNDPLEPKSLEYAKQVGALMTTIGVIAIVLSLLLVGYLMYNQFSMTELLSLENASFVVVSIIVLALGSYIVDLVNKNPIDVKTKLDKVCVTVVVLTSALFGANINALISDRHSIENNLKMLLKQKMM
jgi:hypothetical protein